MSLSPTIQLPLQTERILSDDPKELEKYLRELTFTLQRMYEELADNINGDIRNQALETGRKWTPTLNGSTSGTFTYDHQIGWILRKGLMVDLWFDIKWSAVGTAANNLYLELPYEVATSLQKPFVGVVQSSAFAYTGGTGIVINAIPNTYRGEFWNVGDGFTTANQSVVASGQLIGHIRYIGKQDE